MLRAVSNQRTEVDGRTLRPGEEAQVRPGTTVRLAQVMTLKFLGGGQSDSPEMQLSAAWNGRRTAQGDRQ